MCRRGRCGRGRHSGTESGAEWMFCERKDIYELAQDKRTFQYVTSRVAIQPKMRACRQLLPHTMLRSTDCHTVPERTWASNTQRKVPQSRLTCCSLYGDSDTIQTAREHSESRRHIVMHCFLPHIRHNFFARELTRPFAVPYTLLTSRT